MNDSVAKMCTKQIHLCSLVVLLLLLAVAEARRVNNNNNNNPKAVATKIQTKAKTKQSQEVPTKKAGGKFAKIAKLKDLLKKDGLILSNVGLLTAVLAEAIGDGISLPEEYENLDETMESLIDILKKMAAAIDEMDKNNDDIQFRSTMGWFLTLGLVIFGNITSNIVQYFRTKF